MWKHTVSGEWNVCESVLWHIQYWNILTQIFFLIREKRSCIKWSKAEGTLREKKLLKSSVDYYFLKVSMKSNNNKRNRIDKNSHKRRKINRRIRICLFGWYKVYSQKTFIWIVDLLIEKFFFFTPFFFISISTYVFFTFPGFHVS